MATDRKKILGPTIIMLRRYLPVDSPKGKILPRNQKTPQKAPRKTLQKTQPFWQEFKIKLNPDATILDAINSIKDKQDGSVTCRYACKMGICGSCGATVNGKPVLMCQTFVKNLAQPIRVEPMRNFPIIKDLAVDIDDTMNKMRGVMPYVKRLKEKAIDEGEYIQTPKQLKKIEQTSRCIKCMLCCSACPVYGNDKNFIDPAVSALAYRYIRDSRDQAKKHRLDKVIGRNGVFQCSLVGECSRVCPKNVDPASAIQRLKLRGAFRLFKEPFKKLLK